MNSDRKGFAKRPPSCLERSVSRLSSLLRLSLAASIYPHPLRSYLPPFCSAHPHPGGALIPHGCLLSLTSSPPPSLPRSSHPPRVLSHPPFLGAHPMRLHRSTLSPTADTTPSHLPLPPADVTARSFPPAPQPPPFVLLLVAQTDRLPRPLSCAPGQKESQGFRTRTPVFGLWQWLSTQAPLGTGGLCCCGAGGPDGRKPAGSCGPIPLRSALRPRKSN